MNRTKEVIVIAQSIPKRTVTKDYPKSKSPAWMRNFYNGDRQNQENHQ
jgi:hypothetical protein